MDKSKVLEVIQPRGRGSGSDLRLRENRNQGKEEARREFQL